VAVYANLELRFCPPTSLPAEASRLQSVNELPACSFSGISPWGEREHRSFEWHGTSLVSMPTSRSNTVGGLTPRYENGRLSVKRAAAENCHQTVLGSWCLVPGRAVPEVVVRSRLAMFRFAAMNDGTSQSGHGDDGPERKRSR